MNISTIQKRKFLLNLYKVLYSKAVKPSEKEVRKEFNRYFNAHRLGYPVDVPFSLLDRENTVDPEILNELMANSLLNLEVLYEAIAENNNELFSVVTSLNSKLDNLKSKRRGLEAKVDQLLFANNNSDGFFYSYLESFSNLSGIDMNLTTAYVDVDRGFVSIPKLENNISSNFAKNGIPSADVRYSVIFDGSLLVQEEALNDFDVLFDGLNDTYWSYRYESEKQGVVTIKIQITFGNPGVTSSISGYTMGSSPMMIAAKMGQVNGGLTSSKVKPSKGDYSRFSFQFDPANYSKAEITMYKTEPDRIIPGTSKPYVYDFGLREIFISSSVYDKKGIVVSNPISIPVADNEILEISSVSIDVSQQIPNGTTVDYFIAPEKKGAQSVYDFDWVRLSPTNVSSNGIPTVANLVGSNLKTEYIASGYDLSTASYFLIDENTTSSNINELNPVKHPYVDHNVWRIARVPADTNYIQPYILSGINAVRLKEIILDYTESSSKYKNLDYWVDGVRNDTSVTVSESILNGQLATMKTDVQSQSIGVYHTKLRAPIARSISSTLSKSRSDFNLAVYLNGVLIADLPSGTIHKDIDWDFTSGTNEIYITYDKPFSDGTFSFSIFSGIGLNEYGTVYVDYINYLSPQDFRHKIGSVDNIFTIDTLYSSREILSSKKLSGISTIGYYSNVSDTIESVRFRADLSRYENIFASPLLDSVRTKFKHNDG